MSGGRPTEYKREYCEMLIQHMSKGYSYTSFAGRIGVSFKTLYNWEGVYEEFLQAKRIGEAAELLKWEELTLEHVISRSEANGKNRRSTSLNAGVWHSNMRNRFRWRDRVKEEIEDEAKANASAWGQISISDIKAALLLDPVEREFLRKTLLK